MEQIPRYAEGSKVLLKKWGRYRNQDVDVLRARRSGIADTTWGRRPLSFSGHAHQCIIYRIRVQSSGQELTVPEDALQPAPPVSELPE